MWANVKDWAGVVALAAGVLLWLFGAIGFQAQTTGVRITALEVTAEELRSFKNDQDQVNRRLQVWMCVTDHQSAVMAQVPCAALGVGIGR